MNDPERNVSDQGKPEDREIDRRLIDDQAEGEAEIVDAAAEASERERGEPGSPERVERGFGVEDPSH